MLGDRRLAERVARGDARAFDELYRRHYQQIFRYCRSILRNEEDARDALQNTMTKALGSLPGDGRQIRLKSWLFRVAHNECIDMLRAARPVDALDGTERDPSRSVEAEVAGRQHLRQVLDDIAELPERQRSVLVMRELNDLGFEEISEAVGSSPAACRQTLYEARLALQVMEEGRSMDCAEVRAAISDGDRRVLRGRTVRAHLRGCDGCTDFRAGIEARQSELRALVPFLPMAAATSILSAIGGGGSGLGGGLVGLFGSGSAAGGSAAAGGVTAGGSAAAGAGAGIMAGVSGKAVAVLAVTVGLGAGAAGVVSEQRSSNDGDTDRAAPAFEGGPGVAEGGAAPALTPVAVPAAVGGSTGTEGDPGSRGSLREGSGGRGEVTEGSEADRPGHGNGHGNGRTEDHGPSGSGHGNDPVGGSHDSANGHQAGSGKGHGSRPTDPGPPEGVPANPGQGSGRPKGPPPSLPTPPNRPAEPAAPGPAAPPSSSPAKPPKPVPPPQSSSGNGPGGSEPPPSGDKKGK
jgi:RNA polymerase sigma factor (sigma-70 family)